MVGGQAAERLIDGAHHVLAGVAAGVEVGRVAAGAAQGVVCGDEGQGKLADISFIQNKIIELHKKVI